MNILFQLLIRLSLIGLEAGRKMISYETQNTLLTTATYILRYIFPYLPVCKANREANSERINFTSIAIKKETP